MNAGGSCSQPRGPGGAASVLNMWGLGWRVVCGVPPHRIASHRIPQLLQPMTRTRWFLRPERTGGRLPATASHRRHHLQSPRTCTPRRASLISHLTAHPLVVWAPPLATASAVAAPTNQPTNRQPGMGGISHAPIRQKKRHFFVHLAGGKKSKIVVNSKYNNGSQATFVHIVMSIL